MPKEGGGGKRAGKGCHGSLTKAGKVRGQQPKHWDLGRKDKKGRTWKHYRKHKNPRVANRRKFEKQELLRRKSGQNRVK